MLIMVFTSYWLTYDGVGVILRKVIASGVWSRNMEKGSLQVGDDCLFLQVM